MIPQNATRFEMLENTVLNLAELMRLSSGVEMKNKVDKLERRIEALEFRLNNSDEDDDVPETE